MPKLFFLPNPKFHLIHGTSKLKWNFHPLNFIHTENANLILITDTNENSGLLQFSA